MTDLLSDPRNVLSTVRDLIRYGVSRLNASGVHFGHGSDNAWDEAIYLVLHALHLPPDQLDPFLDARVLPDERSSALKLIDRRCDERLPAPYLTHEAWLQGFHFYVDQRVIVPRSPIAELLVRHVEPWIRQPEEVSSVLDLCTGSGCLAIIAAHAFPQALVDATDISQDALDVAARNVAEHGLRERVGLYHGSLFEPLPADSRYDLILSNPPYVNSESMATLPEEYRREPELALAGGVDGMDVVTAILGRAAEFLTDEGLLLIEIGHERNHFEAAFPHLDPVWLDTAGASDQILLLTREQLLS